MGLGKIKMDMLGNRSGTLILALIAAACNAIAGQAYYSPISINSGQVPSTQSNFPVLVSQTDNRFRTIANGGHVADAQGDDIRPYSDSGLTTALTYERERYNATTGEIVMWVKVASLSSSTTPIYLGYGDTSLTTDGSDGPNTFSNGYIDVYHVKDGTTLDVNSATGTHNGTNHSATATAGKVDGAASFASASSQYIDSSGFLGPAAITMSAWVNATSFPGAYNGVVVRSNAGYTDYVLMLVKSTGKLAMYCRIGGPPADTSYDGTGSNTLSTSTWYYLTLVYDNGGSGGIRGYVNAGSDGTTSISSRDLVRSDATVKTTIGDDQNTASRFWNGAIDQVTISSVARSPDWITTEYNQGFPATFETLGTEVSLAAARGWFHFFPR